MEVTAELGPAPLALICAFAQLTLYFLTTTVAPEMLEPKKRAYVMCLYVSIGSSITAFTYLPGLVMNGLDFTSYLTEDTTSRFVTINFITYLVLDLLVGVFHYPKYLQLITSWIHHPAYIILLSYAFHQRVSLLFVISLPLEVPTAILAVGTMWPHLRSDNMFGLAFLVFRICYHMWCLVSLCTQDTPPWMWKICAIALVPHFHWFYTWVSKYWFKSSKAKPT